jgi:ribosomal protein L40E
VLTDASLEMAICDHCEGLSPESSRYCVICGSPMPGISQIGPGRIGNENEPKCRKCGAGNPEHSTFCNACGRYLRWRRSLAIIVLPVSVVVVMGLLGGIPGWLLLLLWAVVLIVYYVLWSFFFSLTGPARPYWQWKARMQLRRDLKRQVPSGKRP